MNHLLVEENGHYGIDCSNAIWSTDKVNRVYHDSSVQLKDVDFIIESEDKLLLVEYKNSKIGGAVKPESFHPFHDKKVNSVIDKFYDSLHYLTLLEKDKPKYYIYILEHKNGDCTSRKRMRNRLKKHLPFKLQEEIGNGKKLIESIEVLSIDEWNSNEIYKDFPLKQIV
ncbi:MAG: hypothetical protein Q4D45_08470 [Lachnospiraceae bacterium]|nr:hypothetical protein [Lachnospiraceae bacterium]